MYKDYFLVKGLSGKRKLSGEIRVNGAKNAALKAMAAAVLFGDEVKLENMPLIEDVSRAADLLEELGAEVGRDGRSFAINTSGISSGDLSGEISKRLRASIVFSGPLLARYGKVSFPHPGGCVIGERPIDLFLDGFKKMGAKVREESDGERMRYTVSSGGPASMSRSGGGGKLRGAEIFFKIQSVTGTETFMMAGVLAEGETVIKNAAMEPEIPALAEFLNRCGARIEGAGTPTIKIKGGELLSADGEFFKIPPDRIEAGSFLILAALAGRDVKISDCEPLHIEALINLLKESGIKIEAGKNFLRVRAPIISRKAPKAINVKTHEYPGFPTDLQAPMTVYLTQAEGESMVFETIFEGRLSYAESLKRMGAQITSMDPHRVMVKGPTPMAGKELESPDLRAGLAFVIAAIIANGESVIHNVYNIDRGYERVEERLKSIGVSIGRIPG